MGHGRAKRLRFLRSDREPKPQTGESLRTGGCLSFDAKNHGV
jgi:hypothetical protein